MRSFRIALAAAVLIGAGLGLTSGPVVAVDPDITPPSGTVTINDGEPATASPLLTVHLAATDDTGITGVMIVISGNSMFADFVPYAPTYEVEIPAGFGDGTHTVSAILVDAAGNWGYTPDAVIILDRVAPVIDSLTLGDWDGAPPNTLALVVHQNGQQVDVVRFSADGITWGAPVPFADTVYYPFLDPLYGGWSQLGPRRVYVQAGDLAGNYSNTLSRAFNAGVDPGITTVPAQPATGQRVTFKLDLPHKVTFPAGTHCMWEFMWGNPQSLYWGNRDDTFGFFHTYGSKGGGYCDARTFTMPWMSYPRMMVSFEAYGPDGETLVDTSVGASPEEEAIVPVIASTNRHITYSNIPMVYVLPEDYILELGQPTTYRAYSLGGAPLEGGDWSADFASDADDRFKSGGSSFTFTPHATGFVTVCWNSNTLKSTRWSACYDPPVRRRDVYRPTTTKPVARITPTTIGAASVPVTLTWDGSDRGWGIAKYQLERSTDGGAWKRVLSRKTKTYVTSLAPGHAYRFRVRAIDKYGNAGYWDVGPSFRSAMVEDGSAGITYTGDWAAVSDATARGGTLHEASGAASKAVVAFTGRDIAWLAERGPGHGVAKVYVDGALAATVDLNAAADAPARAVFRRHWATKAAHTVRIVVDGTAGRPIVSVDGFALLR